MSSNLSAIKKGLKELKEDLHCNDKDDDDLKHSIKVADKNIRNSEQKLKNILISLKEIDYKGSQHH